MLGDGGGFLLLFDFLSGFHLSYYRDYIMNE